MGTPGRVNATRLLLLGSGELGKEVAIEAQRLGLEVIACDRYPNAPAMQVAHRAHVIDMLDGEVLKNVINDEKPHFVVPEVEAIATETLIEIEAGGVQVVPTATATRLTMDREGIRRLASEKLSIPTSPYRFAGSLDECRAAIEEVGTPCVVKPVMSSSGKGQCTVSKPEETDAAWKIAVEGGRAGKGRVIVEGFVAFDYEITLLTVRHAGGTLFCPPIGHIQVDGDYRESWQPQPMSDRLIGQCQTIAEKVTEALGGFGLFGVEFFIAGDEVYFSEVSPRPHDTGMVTMISQDLSEFALHVRAILGIELKEPVSSSIGASCAIVAQGDGEKIAYRGWRDALAQKDRELRIFGKPEIHGKRRLGVALARGDSVEQARERAREVARSIQIEAE
ncbi:MAG: formate-dependent phosphoribosylglycinamide formyltransferase [Pseudomonadota bacterium]